MPFWRGAFFVGWGTQFIQAGADAALCHFHIPCSDGSRTRICFGRTLTFGSLGDF